MRSHMDNRIKRGVKSKLYVGFNCAESQGQGDFALHLYQVRLDVSIGWHQACHTKHYVWLIFVVEVRIQLIPIIMVNEDNDYIDGNDDHDINF